MILVGDAYEKLATIEDESIQCVVTSPPYWGLRDYGIEGQIGLEDDMNFYLASLLMVFEQVWRILKRDGTLWVNLGDSYAGGMSRRGKSKSGKQHSNSGSVFAKGKGSKVPTGLKPKDLCGVPWRFALAMQKEGWYLRQDIIWHKPNPMPESVRDRCTKAHEYIFLFTKNKKYYFDNDAIREACKTKAPSGNKQRKQRPSQSVLKKGNQAGSIPWSPTTFHNHENDLELGQRITNKSNHPKGKNKRSVWTVTPKPFKGAHFATFPPDLIEPCILAGSRKGDTVLDPFFGAGTVGIVAKKHGRKYIGIELNPDYAEKAKSRIEATA